MKEDVVWGAQSECFWVQGAVRVGIRSEYGQVGRDTVMFINRSNAQPFSSLIFIEKRIQLVYSQWGLSEVHFYLDRR